MQPDIESFQIIKQKIIKTDEVLKIYLEKKNEVTKITAKYQTLLNKYSDKCKEYDKLANKHKDISVKNEELQNKTQVLEKQCSEAKLSYEALETTYNTYVNSTACKYQSINKSLTDVTRDYQKELKNVTKLQDIINDLKNKSVKAPRSPQKCGKKCENRIEEQKFEIEKLQAQNSQISNTLQALTKKNALQLKEIEDLTTELKQLRDTLKNVKESKNLQMETISACCNHEQDTIQLRTKMEENKIFFESKVKSLENVNTGLKNKLMVSETDISRLEETVVELKFELNILNDKNCNVVSACTQTEVSDDDCMDTTDAILNEMRCVPRILSPFTDTEDENIMNDRYDDISLFNIFENEIETVEPINHQTPVEIPDIVITPPTPTVVANNDRFANMFADNFPIHSECVQMLESETTKTDERKQGNEKITSESNTSNIHNRKRENQKSDEKIVITNSTVSIVLQNDDQSSIASKLVKDGIGSVIKSTTNSLAESGVFRYTLQSCFAASCKKHYCILKYTGKQEPDFLGFGVEEQIPYCSTLISTFNQNKALTTTTNKRPTRIVRRKKPMKSLRRLSGTMYKNIVKDVYALVSLRNKQKRKKIVHRTPIHHKEYNTGYSDSETCSSESESEIKRKNTLKCDKVLQVKENSSLQALRRSNRILQRKLHRERRLFKQNVPAKKCAKTDEMEIHISSHSNRPIEANSFCAKEQHSIQQIRETDGFGENIYETEPHSIDSGYSAHTIGESDGSETLPEKRVKIAEDQTENVQDVKNAQKRTQGETSDATNYKKIKIDLFGSGTDSDSSCNTRVSPRRKAAKKRKLPLKCKQTVKGKLIETIRFEEPLPHLESNKVEEVAVFKKPSHTVKYSKKSSKTQSVSKERMFSDTVMHNDSNEDHGDPINNLEDLQSASATSVKLPCDTRVKKPLSIVKKDLNVNVKASFKRPNCRSRIPESPRSPEPCKVSPEPVQLQPKIIPLDKPKRLSKIVVKKLFDKLLMYPEEGQILQEVAEKFVNQEVSYISRLIINKISSDYYDKPDTKYTPPAPVMTVTQRTLMGFMLRLEKLNVAGLLSCFLVQAEKKLLTEKRLECISPLTRLYVSVLKMQKDVHRMRRMCLEALYFMGNLVVPFVYVTLMCWFEVLPKHNEKGDDLLTKILVKFVSLKNCKEVGYNHTNLRMMFMQIYGYSPDEWNIDQLFTEAVSLLIDTQSKQAEFAVLLICKNQPSLWVFNHIDKHLKPIVKDMDDFTVKGAVISLVSNIVKQFDAVGDVMIIKNIVKWLKAVCDDCNIIQDNPATEMFKETSITLQ